MLKYAIDLEFLRYLDLGTWQGVGSLWLRLDFIRKGRQLKVDQLCTCTMDDWYCIVQHACVDEANGSDIETVLADCWRILAEIVGAPTPTPPRPDRCPGDLV